MGTVMTIATMVIMMIDMTTREQREGKLRLRLRLRLRFKLTRRDEIKNKERLHTTAVATSGELISATATIMASGQWIATIMASDKQLAVTRGH